MYQYIVPFLMFPSSFTSSLFVQSFKPKTMRKTNRIIVALFCEQCTWRACQVSEWNFFNRWVSILCDISELVFVVKNSHVSNSSDEVGENALFLQEHVLNLVGVMSAWPSCSLHLEMNAPLSLLLNTCFFFVVSPIPWVLISFFMVLADRGFRPVVTRKLIKLFRATASQAQSVLKTYNQWFSIIICNHRGVFRLKLADSKGIDHTVEIQSKFLLTAYWVVIESGQYLQIEAKTTS